jgi:pimeloyl-ACP methyl ester carboxylesterase
VKVERCGAGDPVLFIHGWAAGGRVFDSCVAALERTNQCHVVDLPGHGSAIEGHWDIDFDGLVSAVAGYIESLPEPPRIVAWAMGAMITLEVATRARVREVVCIGTPSGGPAHQAAFETMAERMTPDWPRFARSSVDAIVGDRVSPEMHRFLVDMMVATPLPVARRMILEVANRDPEPWVRRIGSPILFVHGSEDLISPKEVSQRLAAANEKAELLVYEGSGHAPHLEEPQRFVADVRSFWKEELDG